MTAFATSVRAALDPRSLYRMQRADADPRRRRAGGAILSAAVGGLLFGPTFGTTLPVVVVVPVAVTALVMWAVTELCLSRAALRVWRLPMTVLAGLLVITWTSLRTTTSAGVPTWRTVQGFRDAVTQSWLRTLQTTAPAAPSDRLAVFVPLLVLVAALVGTQLVMRERSPHGMLPVLPGLAVGLGAEAFHSLTLLQASVGVVAYALAASMVGGPRLSHRPIALLSAATLVGALVISWIDPLDKQAYSLRDHVDGVSASRAITPLDDLAARMASPNDNVFSVRPHGTAIGTDRWQLAVLDRFDGQRWTTDDRLRHLGSGVQPPPYDGVGSDRFTATITLDESCTWLPSQHGLEKADGVHTLVDERAGTLLSPLTRAGTEYDVTWSSPRVNAADLESAKLDDGGAVGRALTRIASSGDVPQAVRDVLNKAIGNARPSFRTALLIERYLQKHYRRSTDSEQTGSSWLDIANFLTSDDPQAGSGASGVRGSGTSEQFAAAYTAMARLAGIPARIAVGFRQPSKRENDGGYIVKNSDAMAWPEVPVVGIGWVPMEPMGLLSDEPGAAGTTSVGKATNKVRAQLPSVNAARGQTSTGSTDGSFLDAARGWLRFLGVLLLVVAIIALVAIPGTKYARAVLRRRREGSDAVVSAWRETCDLLLDHGIPLDGSMTVRDIAGSTAGLVDQSARRAIEDLVELVDEAMWSGDTARPHSVAAAWQAADEVRDCLARWPVVERVAAGLAVRSLRPDRPPLAHPVRT